MRRLRPRVIALAVLLSAAGSLALIPDELDASSSCLPSSLKSRLSQVSKTFGRVSIVSTYRRGARMPNGRRSFHASCQAVDFKPPRGKYAQVASWLKSNHGGGVGTYSCGMHHIHIDTGPRVRFHHCQSDGDRGNGRRGPQGCEGTVGNPNRSGCLAAGASGDGRQLQALSRRRRGRYQAISRISRTSAGVVIGRGLMRTGL